jgi:hypothetical protein
LKSAFIHFCKHIGEFFNPSLFPLDIDNGVVCVEIRSTIWFLRHLQYRSKRVCLAIFSVSIQHRVICFKGNWEPNKFGLYMNWKYCKERGKKIKIKQSSLQQNVMLQCLTYCRYNFNIVYFNYSLLPPFLTNKLSVMVLCIYKW